MTPMPLAAADWIYREVLTPAIREDAADFRVCPCQWGMCLGCQIGQHQACPRRATRNPAAHVLTQTGNVAVLLGERSVYAEVWMAGTPCAWRCPCDCLPPAAPVVDPEQRTATPAEQGFEQADLFGGAR